MAISIKSLFVRSTCKRLQRRPFTINKLCPIALLWTILFALNALAGERACHAIFTDKMSVEVSITTPALNRPWVPVGVQVISISPEGQKKKVYTPLPKDGGKILNLNAVDFPMPRHFWISDGTLKTAFIEVDMRPGSKLQQSILMLAARVARLQGTRGGIAQVLRTLWSEKFRKVEKGWRGGLPDDYITPHAPSAWNDTENMRPGHSPVDTGLIHPNVPLEYFLAARSGVCIHKSLLSSLILEALGVQHKLVSGEAETLDSPNERTGHTWIELLDGTILDPEWQTIAHPTTEGAPEGWFFYEGRKMYRSQTFPITVEPEQIR